MNKKFFSSALFIGIFFCMAFCVSLNVANAGNVASGGNCSSSSDCVSGLWCNTSGLNNFFQGHCESMMNTGTTCASGLNVTATDLQKCQQGCIGGLYYDWLAGTNSGGNQDYRCGTIATADPHGAAPTSTTSTTTTPASAANPAGTSGGTLFTNPLNFNTVQDLLNNVLLSVQMIIGTLALVFIVIGAVMILSSAGTPEMVERGKKTITMAFIGLAIGVAAPSLLKELAKAIGWGGTATTAAALSLSQIALNVLNFLLGIAGVLTLIMLVIGGIMYLTSAGDEDRIDSGKKIFRNSLIGIVIILAAMVLVQQVAKFFVAG